MSGKKGAITAPLPSGTIKDTLNSRVHSSDSSSATVEDIKADKKQDVRSEEDSKIYLTDESPFHTHGESFSLNALANTLFIV
jgi:hypothetical protein